ncbi:MAG TPA: sigma-70 family RNA polymerase sigma factor [Gemmataceae bacterium]|nr:sigma-70 family RNA polymerase sigma factor [Gemmataceae bacterium]
MQVPDWQVAWTEYGPTVWRTVYRLLGHHADALDCYQETFFAAWQFAQRNHVEDWAAFLTKIATRRAIDRLRQRIRSQQRFAPLHEAPEPATSADCPVQHARDAELMALVREGLAELPEKQAEVFWLSCIEGLSHQQISAHMQVPPGEVRVLLHRARVGLATMLESTLLDERENDRDR